MMEFAILAAGEGSRLQAEGVNTPKPLVTLHGVPMIERLIRLFARNGAHHVHVVINKQSDTLKDYLENTDFGIPVYTYRQDTPSSLHSLQVLTEENPSWESCIVTTVDTVFSEADFTRYCQGFIDDKDADAYMGITSFVDDESPLFLTMDEDKRIHAFTDEKLDDSTHVSGGIYGLRRRAIETVAASVAKGESRMRNYQRNLLTEQLIVKGHPFQKVVDVDHVKDCETAASFLKEIGETIL